MQIYEVVLNSRQYAMLKGMLIFDRKKDLLRKVPIEGSALFYDIMYEIYSPVIDGWSTPEFVLKESTEAIDLLRFITQKVFPDNENYFVRQLTELSKRKSKIKCEKECAFIFHKSNN
ncbi:MAG: hypothetical protein K2I30_00735 [Clostridia bacterium]|nr:hypothetical protein [Clostridia bacterium]